MKPELGTCYYPEHWSQDMWQRDAERMIEVGISWVRIGEFAWSRIEPQEGKLEWEWLDKAVQTLGEVGLKIVMGTPSATPPIWMVKKYPDMLAVGKDGHVKQFGSRRHYCFSHFEYRREAVRMATLMGERYGHNTHVAAWQIDNEYGCHNTTLSYSPHAQMGFQDWLAQKYQSPQALNRAWGNVFWSMEVSSFDEIGLPNLTVCEPNPIHELEFFRYTSDQVVAFNLAQVKALRTLTDRPLIHNYMGRILDFDHYKVGDDLDIASWDSYPLGFLEDRSEKDEAFKHTYSTKGDPDFQAFHHDLYRSVGKGRWWVMEQQPGPVNWAPYNPAPAEGMVKLWTLEAIAHGAEVVSYFRWRQAHFAQEQMHSGLLRVDDKAAPALHEAEEAHKILTDLDTNEQQQSDVAIIFDYESAWAWHIQRQGKDFDYFNLIYDFYCGLRKLGQSIDILPPNTENFGDRKLVLIPALFAWNNEIKTAMKNFNGTLLIGPRSGSKTKDFAIPSKLPPEIDYMDITVERVETLRPSSTVGLKNYNGTLMRWFEHITTLNEVVIETTAGAPALIKKGKTYYLAGWPDEMAMQNVLKLLLEGENLPIQKLKGGLRLRESKHHKFWIDYDTCQVKIEPKEKP